MDPAFRAPAVSRTAWMLIPVIAFVLLHGALLAFDLSHPDAVFGGDRAATRWQTMQAIMATDSRDARDAAILHFSQPGDYLLHTRLHELGGFRAIILTQLLIAFGSLLTTMGLVRTLGATPLAATMAGLLFVFLPGSMISPHLLTTETFFTFCMVSGTLLLAAGLRGTDARLLWLAILPWALGAFIRPQGMIFLPLAMALIAWWTPQLRRQAVGAALACLLLFPGLWLLWRYSLTGEVGMGVWEADLGVNLRIRAHRALSLLGIKDWYAQDPVTTPRISVLAFLQLFATHPVGFLKTLLSDLTNLALNPGANAVFGHYLRLFETTPDTHYWKLLMDREGLGGVIAGIWNNGPAYVTAFVALGAVHALALVGGIVGLWVSLRTPDAARRVRVLVAFVLGLALAVIFLAGLVRWGHRAPAEPLVAAFAGIGLLHLGRLLAGRRRPQRRAVHTPEVRT